MPLYSYRCKACGHEFETLVRSSDVPACASCNSTELDKLVSLTAPEARSKGILANTRAVAKKEGHFSNYSRAERSKL